MKNISVHDFKKAIESEVDDITVDFIDVRTVGEYNQEHIDRVRNLPLDEISSRLSEFNDKNKIYVHCLSGGRSLAAIEYLESEGVMAELVNVVGGVVSWRSAGFSLK